MGEQLAPMTTVPAALVGTDPPVPAFAPTTATMASATPSATLAVDALHATARRDADLADRVRAVIDDLKTQITAPQAVADLFALDRAVTQLRRGASLSAVIAQRDVPSGAPASMRLADAVRMASAEASNAPSVAIDLRADPTVDGATGEQLAHVLGELFDHESLFGDRDHPIEVSGSPDGDAFTMAIRQWGPALSADDLASINTYLGGAIPSGPDVEPSTLGLYVAGQLAARAGIHLTASAARDRTAGHTGTLVQVHIPADLVAGCEAAATPPPAVPKPFTPVNGGYAPVFASGPQTLALAMPDASPAHATGAVPTVGTLVFDANALSYEPNPLSFEPEIVSFAPPVGRPAPEQPPVESAWLPAFGAFAEPGDHTPDIRGEALAELSNLAGRSAGAARPRPSAGKPATHAGRVDRDAEDLRRLLTTLTSTTSTTDPAGSEQ
jgi:hypothetical protein